VAHLSETAAGRALAWSKLDLARQHLAKHDPIAEKTIKRMFESGRAIVFKEKMAYPCKTVSTEKGGKEPIRITGKQRPADNGKHQRAADKVQTPTDEVLMFTQVKQVKLME
jgi:phosphoketolase